MVEQFWALAKRAEAGGDYLQKLSKLVHVQDTHGRTFVLCERRQVEWSGMPHVPHGWPLFPVRVDELEEVEI